MGSHLDKPVVEKETDNNELHGGLLYSASAMQGWRVNMEDSHYGGVITIAGQPASLVCVFDGHGGDLVAIEAAKRIKGKMEAGLSGVDGGDAEAIGVKMQEVFMSLDEDLSKLPAVTNDEDQSGCTAIVGIVTDKHVIVANAGDARGILHVGGVTKPMSFDHKPTLEKETARIEAAGGCVSMKRVNGDLAVSRALGDFTYKRTASVAPKDQMVSAFPDIEIHERTGEEQFMLLCCDGIWDVMKNEDAGKFVEEELAGAWAGMPLSAVCENLLDRCLAKGSRDNMSAVVLVDPSKATIGTSTPPTKVGKLDLFFEHKYAYQVYVSVQADGSVKYTGGNGERVVLPQGTAVQADDLQLTDEEQDSTPDGQEFCFRVGSQLFKAETAGEKQSWLKCLQ